jgi:hypothetical protein
MPMGFFSSRMLPPTRTGEVDSCRRASHAFVDKLFGKLHEGISRAVRGVDGNGNVSTASRVD